MQANFDARTGAAGGLTGSIERKQPEARKDRWMLELERAAMADGAANRAPRGAPAAKAAAGEHVAAAPAGTVAAHATAASAAPARQAAQARQAPRAQQDALGRQDAPDRPLHRPGGVPRAAGQALQFEPGARWSSTAPGGRTAAPAAAWVAAHAAGGPSLSPSLEAGPAAAAPLSRAAAAGLPLALASGLPLAPPKGAMAEAPSGRDAPAAEAPAQDQALPEGEEYARSLLHVLHAEDGVHAWLRDASLSGEQVRRVASAMAGELALAGTPLSALTVNGRRILSSGAAGSEPDRRAAGHAGGAPAAPSTPFAYKGV